MDEIQYSANGHERAIARATPREIVMKYLPSLPWVLASIAICLIVAFIKLRYSPNIYHVTSTMLVKDDNPYASSTDKFGDIFLAQPSRNLNDEIQLIRSRNMARRVIHALGLEVQYFNKGKIRASQVFSQECPINLQVVSLKDSSYPFTINFTAVNDREFLLNGSSRSIQYGQIFENRFGIFLIRRTSFSFSSFASNDFVITYSPAAKRAGELINNLSASQSGESNSIIKLTYETENTKTGIEILNSWMEEYQDAGVEDKRLIASSALTFIDQQMDTVSLELGSVERNLQGYREKNRVYNPEQQTQQFFSTLSDLDKEITQQEVQLQIVNNLIAYVGDARNPYRKVGSTLGISEPGLVTQITSYNQLQVQRETLLKTTPAANPMVVDLDAAIEKLRVDILQNLRNIKQGYELAINNLKLKNIEAGREVSMIPSREKQLLDITRRQKILEELYSYLLQKKLETAISSASTISNVRVIEPAISSGVAVKPNRKGAYLVAFLIGLMIPVAIIFLMEYLNDKVKSREDIQKVTQAPIIGEIGHSEEKYPMVVKASSRRFIAEQFRIIRTNLQYVLPKSDKPCILVTSTSSGEGKTFVSTNIGAVMALAGKKTAIMEFDIRKPKIMETLGIPRKNGITNYIIGNAEFEDLPVQVPGYENLFIIPCGPVPPNPAELLLNPRLGQLMKKIKENFDAVIIDTAPVGLVSDAVALGTNVDATLYIVRQGYTYKKQLELLNEMYTNKRLPRISLVINDIKSGGGLGRYYGYGGYGYGGYYGYGYGSEYFDEKQKAGNLRRRLMGIFKK